MPIPVSTYHKNLKWYGLSYDDKNKFPWAIIDDYLSIYKNGYELDGDEEASIPLKNLIVLSSGSYKDLTKGNTVEIPRNKVSRNIDKLTFKGYEMAIVLKDSTPQKSVVWATFSYDANYLSLKLYFEEDIPGFGDNELTKDDDEDYKPEEDEESEDVELEEEESPADDITKEDVATGTEENESMEDDQFVEELRNRLSQNLELYKHYQKRVAHLRGLLKTYE